MIYRMTHEYNIGNQDVYLICPDSNTDVLRAAVYLEFKSEEFFEDTPEYDGYCLSTAQHAELLVKLYGCRYAPDLSQIEDGERCKTIDLYWDRAAMCGDGWRDLMQDETLHRDNLYEEMKPYFDCLKKIEA
jgi:hypothetical protein